MIIKAPDKYLMNKRNCQKYDKQTSKREEDNIRSYIWRT